MQFLFPGGLVLPIALGATDVDGAFLGKLAKNSVDGIRAGVFAIDEKGNVHGRHLRRRTLYSATLDAGCVTGIALRGRRSNSST